MGLTRIQKIKVIVLSAAIIALSASLEAATINKVVAVVNDEVITQQDIDQLLSVLYAQYSQEYKDDELLRKMEEVKKDILNQIIEDKLVLSRAKELGIKVTDAEIDERLDYIKKSFPTEKEFYKLVIHSVLHIIGFDHEQDAEYEEMKKWEDIIWEELFERT